MARKYRRQSGKPAKPHTSSMASTTEAVTSPRAMGSYRTSSPVDKYAYVKSDLRRIGVITTAILLGYALLFVLNQQYGWI